MRKRKPTNPLIYVISIFDSEAFAANKQVGFFSTEKAITNDWRKVNTYLTKSGAKRRIERLNRESHFSSNYTFHVTSYDRRSNILSLES